MALLCTLPLTQTPSEKKERKEQREEICFRPAILRSLFFTTDVLILCAFRSRAATQRSQCTTKKTPETRAAVAVLVLYILIEHSLPDL